MKFIINVYVCVLIYYFITLLIYFNIVILCNKLHLYFKGITANVNLGK